MNIEICELKKAYGGKEALKGVSFTLTEGVYGILGPNGAGKSTLMNILTGNLKADSGQVLMNGVQTDKLGSAYRKQLGFMPQQQALYPGFTAARFLDYVAALKGLEKRSVKREIDEVLDLVGLLENRNDKIKSFSGGMKQRLLIAQAILGKPSFMILDEPTAGLDPKQRIAVRNLIAEIAMERIVLIATHVVSDVEFIAKEIILLKDGSVLKKAPRDELIREMEDSVFEVEVPEQSFSQIPPAWQISNVARFGKTLYVRVISCDGCRRWPCKKVRPSLEDVYLYHFGGE